MYYLDDFGDWNCFCLSYLYICLNHTIHYEFLTFTKLNLALVYKLSVNKPKFSIGGNFCPFVVLVHETNNFIPPLLQLYLVLVAFLIKIYFSYHKYITFNVNTIMLGCVFMWLGPNTISFPSFLLINLLHWKKFFEGAIISHKWIQSLWMTNKIYQAANSKLVHLKVNGILEYQITVGRWQKYFAISKSTLKTWSV